MLSKLFKPRWQHSDAAVREAAIKSISDQELLHKIAKEDTSIGVKKAAITQLSDLDHLLDLHHKEAIQSIVQKRIHEILLDRINYIHYDAALGSYLLETADPDIIENILEHSKDRKLQKLAIECSQSTEILLNASINADNSETRILAASKLQDETAIRQALKALGKRDKRVSQMLRENLDQITTRRNQTADIAKLLATLERLGNNNLWQHDQARYEKLRQQWQDQYQSLATARQIQDWKTLTSALEVRLTKRKEEYASLQPVLNSMQSLCNITTGFVNELAGRSFLRKPEASEINSTLDSFADEWHSLPVITTTAAREYQQEFQKNLQQCREQIVALIKNGHASQRSEALIEQAEKLLNRKTVPEISVHRLVQDWKQQPLPENKTLAENLQSDFTLLENRLLKQLEIQQAFREKGLLLIDQWLNNLDQALAGDQTKKASKLFRQIEQKLNEFPECPRDKKHAITNTLANYRPRLRELEGWRHWGTDLAREELIKEAQDLANNSEISINLRAEQLKALRQRWKKLGKIDPQSGRKLWQQFDAACTEAYQPVKKHQKNELNRRNANLQKRITICEELESINQDTDWNTPAWRDIDKRFNRLHSQWKNAGPVNRKDWENINERFKQAIADIDNHLEDERRISLNRRLALIEKVEQAQDYEDLAEAIKIAGEAQKVWHPTVTGKRHEEQKLWTRFRSALDVIYARDKDRRKDDANAVKSLLQQKQAICDAVKELTHLDGAELQTAHSQRQKLQSEWDALDEIRSRDGKKVEQTFHRLMKQLDEQYAKQKLLQKKNLVLQQLKGECPAEDSDRNDDINTLILELEIILEIESPETEAKARMQLQVERLADAMSSRHETDEFEEIMSLAKRVCQCRHRGVDFTEFEDRVEGICDRLLA